jgi:hypothetical protein
MKGPVEWERNTPKAPIQRNPVSEGSRSRDSLNVPDRSSLAIDIIGLSRRGLLPEDRWTANSSWPHPSGARIFVIALGPTRYEAISETLAAASP